MASEQTTLWIVAIVAVVGIVAMVIGAGSYSAPGAGMASYYKAPNKASGSMPVADYGSPNMAGNAKARPVGCIQAVVVQTPGWVPYCIPGTKTQSSCSIYVCDGWATLPGSAY